MIKDIYHWRLQTTLAIVAGYASIILGDNLLTIPGFLELPYGWQLSTAKNSCLSTNTGSLQCGKYSIESVEGPPLLTPFVLRLIPGLMTIEIVTLGFPIYTMFRNNSAAREINNALADFDQKQLQSYDEGNTLGDSQNSLKTKGSTRGSSRKGKMYPMESLDACLRGNHDGLQIYASCMELNGENIIFLTKVIAFAQQCQKSFHETCKSPTDFRRARSAMFRVALSIFVSLVHADTASYPINIESTIYSHLNAIFGPATALIASVKQPSRSPSIATPISSSSKITPWDDDDDDAAAAADDVSREDVHDAPAGYSAHPSYPLRAMSNSRSSGGNNNESSEHIVHVREDDDTRGDNRGEAGGGGGADVLEGVQVPAEFDERVFDAAFESVKFMVWSETWQRFMHWRGGVRVRGDGGIRDEAMI